MVDTHHSDEGENKGERATLWLFHPLFVEGLGRLSLVAANRTSLPLAMNHAALLIWSR